MKKTATKKDILLIEDNPGDVALVLEAFNETNGEELNTEIFVVEDGEEAMNYLKQEGKYANKKLQDIIILDLNIPKKDGRKVLSEIKSNASLEHIPVIILTTSTSRADILNSYKLHTNCYITKPAGIKELREIVKYIKEFWLNVVSLP